MGDENPICTLEDYSKPSHEGYKNTIELLAGNNMVPLRSDTIWLVQNGCSFQGLWCEDPNQHLKNFLRLVDSLDLDSEIWKERTCVYFNFPFVIKLAIGLNAFQQDPSPHGRILLLDSFLNSFHREGPQNFAKLRNDILMFQQHHGETLSDAWTRFKDLLPKVPHHGINLWLQDDMIGKINLLWKTVSEKLNDVSTLENAGNPMTYKSIVAINYDKREELRKNGIKSPSKLFFPKYLSPASIKELNKNPPASKRVYFINSIVILSTDSDTEEEDISSNNAHENKLGNMVRKGEEVKEQGKEEDEIETDKEVEEYSKRRKWMKMMKTLTHSQL
uniref:Zinc finger, CCHC-type n=1 Tax=Tanacetum cinerariifolium TaxID=118510 RepID=A0A6L2N9E0_TANCI|nr:zinc finger, CCHC-type [Tanacetum cinerariifolium]